MRAFEKDSRFLKIRKLMSEIESEYDISRDEIVRSIPPKIPISIFDSGLSGFEAIVKYLRENENLTISEVARITGRSKQCTFGTYNNANKKFSRRIIAEPSQYDFPLTIISEKNSVLESIVRYLHEEKELSFAEISRLIKRDQRTIWTAYNRCKIKK